MALLTIPRYGDGRRYPLCETCQSDGFPADMVLEEPGQPPHFVCWDCAMLGFRTGGRFDLAMDMERERRTMMHLRRDPKSPSYRGGLA